MTITLTPDIEIGLIEQAQEQGKAPEMLALERLREDFAKEEPTELDLAYPPIKYSVKTILPPQPKPIPHEEWLRLLRSAASPCGVSLSNEAASSEGIYE